MFTLKEPKKLKRVPIKEELVVLTGDFIKAVILQQFIYWSERTRDIDDYIREETCRAEMMDYEVKMELTGGWIWKSMDQLSEETMLGLKHTAMREHTKVLVNNKWLSERTNPNDRRDRTLQYRVNLLNIQLDLMKLGYSLEGYTHPIPLNLLTEIIINLQSQNPEMQNTLNGNAISESGSAPSESGNAISEKCDATIEKMQALPEITSETTSETISERNNLIIDSWKKVLDQLQTQMNPQSYDTWIAPLNVMKTNHTLILICPNKFVKEWIISKYKEIINRSVKTHIPDVDEIKITCD